MSQIDDDRLSVRSDRTSSSKISNSQSGKSITGIKNFSLFDVTLDPLRQREMENVIKENLARKQDMKLNSPTFKGSIPFIPSSNSGTPQVSLNILYVILEEI